MSKEKDLVKNTIILSIGKFAPKLLAMITLPILTAQLTKREYGTYDLIDTLIMLVIPIATLQIQSAAFRFLIDCREDDVKKTRIISTMFGVTLPISLIISMIIPFFFSSQFIQVKILVGVYFLVDTLNLTIGQIVRGLGHNKEFAIASISLSTVNMIGIVLSVQLAHKGLHGVLISLVLANSVSILYLVRSSNILLCIKKECFSVPVLKQMLAFSWPMVPNNLSNWALKLSDRFVIIAAISVEANVVYAAANKIPNLLSLAQSVLVMAWQENAAIALHDDDSDRYFSKMLDNCYKLMFGCTALLIAGTPIIFKLLIQGEYDEAYYQMPILILASFYNVMASFFGGIYVAHNKTLNVGLTTITAAAINLIIDILLVKIIGITAGAISTLVAFSFLYYYRLINVRSFQKIKYNLKSQLGLLIILIGMLGLYYVRNITTDCVNIVLGIVFFVVFNKVGIQQAVNKVMKNKSGKK